MNYLGGKAMIAKWVAEHVLLRKGDRTHYLEPFLGSGAVFREIAPHFSTTVASDIHPDLILMWQALVNGWIPPETITREEYQQLKKAEPSALRGIVGFGSSFRGKWFGGYDTFISPKRDGKTFKGSAVNKSLSLVPILKHATITCCSYQDHSPNSSTVVYCDPPYAHSTGYSHSFNSESFWSTMRKWREVGATVIISERTAPSDFSVIASRTRCSPLKNKKGSSSTMVENLYI